MMDIHNRISLILTAMIVCGGITACGTGSKDSETQNETVQTSAEVTAAASETVTSAITEVSQLPEDTPLLVTKKLTEGIYSLDFPGEYMLDEYLESDIKTVEELDRWFMENVTNGISTENSEYNIACSSFAVTDHEGEHLFGRNYDLRPTDAMFIRTSPKEGYSSIGIVDLSHLNIGQDCEYTIDSEEAQSLLLAAPFCICDGINEKGLGVSLLQLDIAHTVNDTEKPDLLLYLALRALLDKCADSGEAVKFLSGYDLYSPSGYSYHIFITDKNGKSVIAEWLDGELIAVEDNAATNFVLFEAPPTRDPDGRYFKLRKALDEDSVFSKKDAMELLETVMQKSATRWSAVYDLDSFTVEACFNSNYDNKYEFCGHDQDMYLQ